MKDHTFSRICISTACILILLASLSASSGQMTPDEWKKTAPGNFSTLSHEEVAGIAEPFINDGTYPGLVIVLVDRNGSAIYSFGRSNRDTGESPDNQTTFEVGSISKTFTGLLLADAERKGVINLSTPIQRYVPAGVTVPSYNGRDITLSDLATHTSGLPDVPDDFFQHQNPDDPVETQMESSFHGYEEVTGERVYEWLSDLTLNRSPGESWEYSNTGTAIAGDITARMQNATYSDLVYDTILYPLGMNSTSAGWRPDLLTRSATGYRGYAPAFDEGIVINYSEFWTPAAGFVSDGDDMAVYLALQLGLIDTPDNLSEAVSLSHKPRAIRSTEEIDLWESLFWDTLEIPGWPWMHLKGGETNRFLADISFIRDEKIGVVVLANTAYHSDRHVESDISVPLLTAMMKKMMQ